MEENKIFYETNYQKFNFLDGNRNIKKSHVEELKRSIDLYGYFPIPITVNENMEIIEGQHRFIALRELGLPIIYHVVEGLSVRECSILNSVSKNWQLVDYIKSYADRGDENYKRLFDLYQKHNKSLGTKPIFNAVNSNMYNRINRGTTGNDTSIDNLIKSGKFTCNENEYLYAEKILGYEERFSSKIKTLKGRKDIYFLAIAFAYRQEDVDKERLVKMFNNAIDLQETLSVPMALDELSRVYNFGYRGERIYLSHEYQKMLDKI